MAHNTSSNLRYYIENNRKEWGNDDDDEARLGVLGSQILLIDLDVGYSSP
jgi:hypothetical protein